MAAFAVFACALAGGLSGCTLYGAKSPPTLKSTTSAEQYERITWADIRAGKWDQITPLLAPNIVYAVQGKILIRDQIIPYLKSRNIRDFVISNMEVKPNGPDMTLSYNLQLSSPGGNMRSLLAVSVWQQMGTGWILIVHTEQPQTDVPSQ